MKNILIASALAFACMSVGYAAPLSAAREAEIAEQLDKLQKINIQIVELLRGVTSKESATQSAPRFEELMQQFVKGGGDSDYKYLLSMSQFSVMAERRKELLRIMNVNGFDSQLFIDVWNKYIHEVSLRPAPPEPKTEVRYVQNGDCEAMIRQLREELEALKKEVEVLKSELSKQKSRAENLTKLQNITCQYFIQNIKVAIRNYGTVKLDSDALSYLDAVEKVFECFSRAAELLESVTDKESGDAVASELAQVLDELLSSRTEVAKLEEKYPVVSKQVAQLIAPSMKVISQRFVTAFREAAEHRYYNSEALRKVISDFSLQ